ncbi:hypothetical protein NL676_013185 [Syzygium grande]|nr:hypothetical protein NL676_013185 [Syzygium grande]
MCDVRWFGSNVPRDRPVNKDANSLRSHARKGRVQATKMQPFIRSKHGNLLVTRGIWKSNVGLSAPTLCHKAIKGTLGCTASVGVWEGKNVKCCW